eukprot:1176911-Prorocentrum_minimum.AAC.1
MHSSPLRLVTTPGIFSLVPCDWFPPPEYALFLFLRRRRVSAAGRFHLAGAARSPLRAVNSAESFSTAATIAVPPFVTTARASLAPARLCAAASAASPPRYGSTFSNAVKRTVKTLLSQFSRRFSTDAVKRTVKTLLSQFSRRFFTDAVKRT